MLSDDFAMLRRIQDFSLSGYLSIQKQWKEKTGLRIVKEPAHHVQYMSALKSSHVVISIPAQADHGDELFANREDGR